MKTFSSPTNIHGTSQIFVLYNRPQIISLWHPDLQLQAPYTDEQTTRTSDSNQTKPINRTMPLPTRSAPTDRFRKHLVGGKPSNPKHKPRSAGRGRGGSEYLAAGGEAVDAIGSVGDGRGERGGEEDKSNKRLVAAGAGGWKSGELGVETRCQLFIEGS